VPVSTLANQVRSGEAGRHEIAGADPPLQMVFLPTTGWTPYRTAMKGLSPCCAPRRNEAGMT
jgi:hypothetical protein